MSYVGLITSYVGLIISYVGLKYFFHLALGRFHNYLHFDELREIFRGHRTALSTSYNWIN